MKACFCVRSIFCAIQSSWISAIAGVSTMVASPSNTESRSLEKQSKEIRVTDASARHGAKHAARALFARAVTQTWGLCGLMTPSSSSDYAISAECGVERHLAALLWPCSSSAGYGRARPPSRRRPPRRCFLHCTSYGAHTLAALSTQGCTLCYICLLYTSPSPRDGLLSRMPSSA